MVSAEGGFVREIREAVEVDAAPSEVWSALVDLARYPDWNPFVVQASGTIALGVRLTVRLVPPGHRGFTMRPTVTKFEAGRTFRWLGHLGIPGIFDGEHIHEVEPVDGRSRYVQREVFRGALVPLVPRMLADTQRGFRAMNQALKARVES